MCPSWDLCKIFSQGKEGVGQPMAINLCVCVCVCVCVCARARTHARMCMLRVRFPEGRTQTCLL